MPVYHVGNVLFILCSTASALSTNMAMLIVFHFLNRFVISSVTLGPSIAGDLFRKEERGTAMSVAIALPLMGPFAAPIVGSYIADAKGWRWNIWIVVIAVGAVTCVACLPFRETYKVKILQRKTKRLCKLTGNKLLRSKYEDATKRGIFTVSLKRPLKMLFFSPIVFIITFFTSLVYGLSYLILTTLTQVMEKNYGFGQGSIGLAFLGRGTSYNLFSLTHRKIHQADFVAVGNITGMIVYGLFSDRYIRYKKSQEGYLKPEHCLPLMLLGAIVLPAGLFLYGWSAEKYFHWIVPLIGTAIVGFSMLLALLPTDNYLVDVYDIHGASAVAVGAALHAVFAAILPLVGPPLYNHLDLGWGNSVLAFISIIFLPALLVLMRYGERIRNSPRFKQDL
jgi:MFS family permease